MNRHEFMRIYNNFYVFLGEGEYIIVSPTAVSEEKRSRDPRVCRGRQWGARARRRRDLWLRRGRQWRAGARWRSAMLGKNIFN
jgi:hypothetical protein